MDLILAPLCLLHVPISPHIISCDMQYFPMISRNSFKSSSKVWENMQIQRFFYTYLFIKTKLFLLHLIGLFMGFNPFTATGRDRGPVLNSKRDNPERGGIQLLESERIVQKLQLEPEI